MVAHERDAPAGELYARWRTAAAAVRDEFAGSDPRRSMHWVVNFPMAMGTRKIGPGDRGATVLTGGEEPGGAGYFYAPTVLTDVPADARMAAEEIFGPVAPLTSFRTEHEVVAAANDTPYGLVAHVYTNDLRRALRVAEAVSTHPTRRPAARRGRGLLRRAWVPDLGGRVQLRRGPRVVRRAGQARERLTPLPRRRRRGRRIVGGALMPRISEARRAAQRRRILDAATACFARSGLDGASMHDIVSCGPWCRKVRRSGT